MIMIIIVITFIYVGGDKDREFTSQQERQARAGRQDFVSGSAELEDNKMLLIW